MKPKRTDAGGRKSEQYPYHPHPKRSSVPSAVGGAHQELSLEPPTSVQNIDNQPSPKSPELFLFHYVVDLIHTLL